ncbi:MULTISPECIES: helix-turn-helix transcriptional regulator [unclassified Streptococcus]|uniref:helix-turn-helix transcriptional regulator n=1 Tax=unclassified Streptococcus TaxID=2608887 RepID=UPI00359CF02C
MNRLKELRAEKGLTQQELADIVDVTKLTIANWENEKHKVKSDKAQQLADYFEVSVGYLLGYSEKDDFYEALHETIAKEPLVAFVEFLLGNEFYLSDKQIKTFLDFLEATSDLNYKSGLTKSEFLIHFNYTGNRDILGRYDEAYILKQYNLIEQILSEQYSYPLPTQKDQPIG